MAVGPQLRSMTDMLLLLIICFAGDESGGFRKPKRTSLSGSSGDAAALAEITTQRNDAGLQDSEGWHLAALGLGQCDGYSRGPRNASECNSSGMELLRKLGRTPGRTMWVGEGTGLPFGCTIQSGGDWTIHYNPHHNNRTGGKGYQFVCDGEGPLSKNTNYLGCYLLKQKVTEVMKSFASVTKCRRMCAGSMFFGLLAPGGCWCTEGQELGIMVPNSKCNVRCQGKRSEICGGHGNGVNFSSVYFVETD